MGWAGGGEGGEGPGNRQSRDDVIGERSPPSDCARDGPKRETSRNRREVASRRHSETHA